jgi:hypothetical protein
VRLVTVPVVSGTIRIDGRSRTARVTLKAEDESTAPVVVELGPEQTRQLVIDLIDSIELVTLDVYQELLAGWTVPR